MTMEASEIALSVVGILVLLGPTYFLWGPWRTRNWPTAKAKVVEIEPKNPDGVFERIRKHNEGTDYGIEYEVHGQLYRKNPSIEMSFKTSGFGAHAVPMIQESFEVRYHPDNPNNYSLVHAYKRWAVWVVTLFCWVAGAAILFASLTP